MINSDKWEVVKLGEVCDINMGQSPDSSSYNIDKDGLPFYQGNADFGTINPVTRYWCNKPTKIALKDDILFSVRAPIGAINIAVERCCIGRGLAAITAKNDVCYSDYIRFLLQSKKESIIQQGTGSTFKSINKTVLLELKIPLPPLETQKKIADELDKITSLIEKRKTQIEKLDLLVKAKFIEMFGDPVLNPMGWEIVKFSNLGELGRGVSKHRPRNDPKLLNGNHPLIQTGEVSNSDLYIETFTNTYSDLGLNQSKMWNKGTLCITIAANIAKTAILKFDACFPDSIVGFSPNAKTNQIFIHYWFSFFQQILELQAPESAQKNINLKILSDLTVINPDIDKQNQFASYVLKTEKTKETMQKGLTQLETLYKQRMQEYFE